MWSLENALGKSIFLHVWSAELQFLPRPLRGIVEETPNTTEHGRPSVMLEKYASATKMQPQSSGSLRSNAGIEKGKEIAARLNIHRIHSQLRGLDSTGQFRRTAAVLPSREPLYKSISDLSLDPQPCLYPGKGFPREF